MAIAHRGSRLLWPENTMEAFSSAVALGFRHLETDLHVTRDGIPVCIHDPTVDRTTDGTGPVSSYDLDELQGLDAGYRHMMGDDFPFRGRGLTVPTLEEVVSSFPEVSLVVDLKADGLVEPLAAMIERLDLYDRLIVGSFSDRRLSEFQRATGGMVPISTGPMLSRIWVFSSMLGRPGVGGAQALQLPMRTRGVTVVNKGLVRVAHLRGLQVHVWTVNTTDEMTRLLDIGVDGLVTDRPDLLRDLLAARALRELS